MLIGDRYKIESDNLNITLYRKGTSKANGNTYWRPIAYFSTVFNALDHLVDLEVAETGLKEFRTVVEKQKELKGLVDELRQSQEVLQLVRDTEKTNIRGIPLSADTLASTKG